MQREEEIVHDHRLIDNRFKLNYTISSTLKWGNV